MIHGQVNLGLEINSLNFEVAQGLKLFFSAWIIGVTKPINTDMGCFRAQKTHEILIRAIEYGAHRVYDT